MAVVKRLNFHLHNDVLNAIVFLRRPKDKSGAKSSVLVSSKIVDGHTHTHTFTTHHEEDACTGYAYTYDRRRNVGNRASREIDTSAGSHKTSITSFPHVLLHRTLVFGHIGVVVTA